MSDAYSEGGTPDAVPTTLASGQESQRTLTRLSDRWNGLRAALCALPVPAGALAPDGAALPNGQQTGAGGPRLLLANRALERLLNYEPGRLCGCPLLHLWTERVPEDLLVEGGAGHARRSDGSLVLARLTIRPFQAGGGLPRVLVLTLEDLRRQRELEARLLRADRLVTQGALVAGVAHEINNPVHLLLANLRELHQVLRAMPPGDSVEGPEAEALAVLEDAHESAQRIADVARDLLHLSNPEVVPAEQIDLNRLVAGVLRLLRPVLSGVPVQRSLGLLPLVVCQRPRLFQVLLNLLLNASHAVAEVEPARRTILVRTEAHSAEGRPGVRIEIEDTGCGMSQAVLERLFEPFFTTKGHGQGTGLGLALSRAIVTQHGGTLQVLSQFGRGTLVRIFLPCEPPADLSSAPPPSLWPVGQKE